MNGNRLAVAGRIVDGTGKPPFDGTIVIESGRIVEITAGLPSGAAQHLPIQHAGAAWIVPGFVDLHCHGGGGGDFTDGTKESTEAAFLHHLQHGTTSLAATTMTAPLAQLEQALAVVEEFRTVHSAGSMMLGVHMEGPFISKRYPGAQHPDWIVPPDVQQLEAWITSYPGLIRQVTLAPEEAGAEEVIALAVQEGIVAACGHSDATYDQLYGAVQQGLRHAVHCGNAMRGLHHREPGVLGGVMLHEELTTEVILDGYHLHEAVVRLLWRTKPGRVCVITDAIRASGWPDGDYQLGGQQVTVSCGAARLVSGALAGSVLTMDRALAQLVSITGIPLHEAVPAATSLPASIYGETEIGTLEQGKRANLLFLHTDTFTVDKVMLDGKWVK